MSQLGQRTKATPAQWAEVERLAAEGVSVRRIAAAVFGDVRFRGRVERILRRPSGIEALTTPSLADPALDGAELGELEGIALIRLLFERRLAWLAASGRAPSMNELRNLLDVQRRLEAAEAFERTRERQEHEDVPPYTGLADARGLVKIAEPPAIGERRRPPPRRALRTDAWRRGRRRHRSVGGSSPPSGAACRTPVVGEHSEMASGAGNALALARADRGSAVRWRNQVIANRLLNRTSDSPELAGNAPSASSASLQRPSFRPSSASARSASSSEMLPKRKNGHLCAFCGGVWPDPRDDQLGWDESLSRLLDQNLTTARFRNFSSPIQRTKRPAERAFSLWS